MKSHDQTSPIANMDEPKFTKQKAFSPGVSEPIKSHWNTAIDESLIWTMKILSDKIFPKSCFCERYKSIRRYRYETIQLSDGVTNTYAHRKNKSRLKRPQPEHGEWASSSLGACIAFQQQKKSISQLCMLPAGSPWISQYGSSFRFWMWS